MRFPKPVVAVLDCIAVQMDRGTLHTGTRPYLIVVDGQRWKASRLSYHLNHRPIPATPDSRTTGLVLHTCDNGWCVNPKHLYLGTQVENMQDKMRRQRGNVEAISAGMTGKVNNPNGSRGIVLTAEQRKQRSDRMIGNKHNEGRAPATQAWRKAQSERITVSWAKRKGSNSN